MKATGWDLAATLAITGVVIAGFLGTLPFRPWPWFAVVPLVGAGIRERHLSTDRGSGPD